jgi:DNA-binding transcriptional ArsR family regulator
MSTIGTDWTFLSSHAHVLICLAENPRAKLRDIADRIGVTERTVMRLITQLDEAGFLRRSRRGRGNYYEIVAREPLRHPIEARCTVEMLLRPVLEADDSPGGGMVTADGKDAGDPP